MAPVQALIEKLNAPNRTVDGRLVPIVVELCNVELDLTGKTVIVGGSRSLIASPGCERGPRNQKPPSIRVRDNPPDRVLFQIRGDQVVFSGFRLEGPNPGIWGGDENTSFGIRIWPYNEPLPIRHVEVSNMEIFNWSGGAIALRDNTETLERGRLFNTNESAVRIRDNYIHHNQHDAGFGYGVVVGNGAYALIEHNVFEVNRHAVAGDSFDGKADFSGYTLRENLILPGGGIHCLANWGFLNCWYTHQIDMHGTKSWWRLGQSCCGTAGETMIIQRNTVLYTGGPDWHWGHNGNAIKIRGNPVDKALVDGNVFRHDEPHDAIAQNGDLLISCAAIVDWPCITVGEWITRPIIALPNNVFGANPLAQTASCDFVGDGQKDEFMATGVTWWAKSLVTQQWRYLNTMPETLAQLQLADWDHDGVCDVAERSAAPDVAPRRYSASGVAPWTPLNAGVSNQR